MDYTPNRISDESPDGIIARLTPLNLALISSTVLKIRYLQSVTPQEIQNPAQGTMLSKKSENGGYCPAHSLVGRQRRLVGSRISF
jgi:hypothetical protein